MEAQIVQKRLNPAYKQQHWIGARQSLLQSIQTYLQTNNSNP